MQRSTLTRLNQILLLAGVLAVSSTPALAQAVTERPSDSAVKALIAQVDDGRDKFEGNLEGDFKGSTIRIEPTYWSSCDSLPYPGSRGILVGRVLSSTGDVLVVDPVRALSQRQLEEQAAAQTFVPH